MSRRLKIISLLLVSSSFYLNSADAGILDGISAHVKSVKDKANQALGDVKGKVSKVKQESIVALEGLKNEATAKFDIAKTKVMEVKDKVAATVKPEKTESDDENITAPNLVEGNQEEDPVLAQDLTEDLKTVTSPKTETKEDKNTVGSIEDVNSEDTSKLLKKSDVGAVEEISEYPEESVAKVDSFFPEKELVEKNKIINASGLSLTDADIPYVIHKLESISEAGVEKITLNLANNQITVEGFAMIFEALKPYPKLISILNLSGNSFGDDGAILFAEYLKNFPMLNFIILSATDISGEGALALMSEIAKGNSEVQMLDLSNNKITGDHLDLIIEQLKSKEGLLGDGLILSGNPMNLPEGAELPKNVIAS